ncbi:cupin domain-containing protein [Bacillus inaquosorum]|uniref:cupin domain-containing protein n=1 Tax=Bacillus inaquosorum TaxID=483913 RepID=UPI00227E14B0|nr:cupin domain-containing protein [Bacillus inaquosorum]MCY7961446.1 cupin domain-containing protein [Bacillus inaquosorum]MCY8492090.1 cupin domain-containing protein [Bacillus inaquosorum]MCY8697636.1 cupin domain-containing protein [Bacillus inaquosorum]MCY8786727.1 cupin domain-containing protein [Bacillus inaquosorum]
MSIKEEVKLNCTLPFTGFIDPYSIKEVISSKTFQNGQWQTLTKLKNFPDGVNKSVFPFDLTSFKILVLTQVKGENHIKPHKHDEPQFRYIISGSFKLNGESYSSGDWVIVPQNHEYEIFTETGYTAITPYGMKCGNDNDDDDDDI